MAASTMATMLEDPRHGRRTERFTLQWHLTHSCDLACKHCYDRTLPSPLGLDDAKRILDGLVEFGARRGVVVRVGLTGGNPLLYPWFFELYAQVVARGVPAYLLGNPVATDLVERLVAIGKPESYQVSLEGLEAHNDDIRGPGSFRRVMEFLPVLRAHGIHAGVMLTLTSANRDQVVPLGRLLRGKANGLTFNRLSRTGNGAALATPDKEAYGEFLVEYLAAAKQNPTLTYKDNLFNIFRHELRLPLLRGCTGHGCGAAFDGFSLLPDGEAHACRKFPSPIGSVLRDGFDAVYDSVAADRYRRGSTACDGCAIRKWCGGCMAVTSGQGLDPFTDRDPHCFMFD